MKYVFLIIIATLFSTCQSMDTSKDFVSKILNLTHTCINANQADLKNWAADEQNPLYTLQSMLAKEMPSLEAHAPIVSASLCDLNPTNKLLLQKISIIKIKQKDDQTYTLAKQYLRNFRLIIVKHNNLISEEKNALGKKSSSLDISQTAKTENVAYAKQLIGTSDPRLLVFVPDELDLMTQLSEQRLDFNTRKENSKQPSIQWLRKQKEILEEYLSIQTEYTSINPILSDERKNERYKVELEKTKLAIQKHFIKNSIKKAAEAFNKKPTDELLCDYREQLEKLQKISPSPEKAEILKEIHSKFFNKITDELVIKAKSPLSALRDQKKYITIDALRTVGLIIALADIIEDTDQEQKQKIKDLAQESFLLKKNLAHHSLMLYPLEIPSMITQWADFYRACLKICEIIPDFPMPFPHVLEENTENFNVFFSKNQYAEIFNITLFQLIEMFPYEGNNENAISPKSHAYSELCTTLCKQLALLENVHSIVDENTVFKDLFDIIKKVTWCRNAYGTNIVTINKIIEHCNLIAENCTNVLIENIKSNSDMYVDSNTHDLVKYYFYDGACTFDLHYQRALAALEDKEQKEKQKARIREEKRKHDDEEAQKKYALAAAIRQQEILSKLKPYQSENLIPRKIADLQINIKNLISLLRDAPQHAQVIEICHKYFEELKKQISSHNLEPKDIVDYFQQYKAINNITTNNSLKTSYTNILFAFLNRLLQMIKIRSGEFNSKSEAQRLSLYEKYLSAINIDTPDLKDLLEQLPTACKDTTNEKIMGILTSRYTMYAFIGLIVVGLAQWQFNLNHALGIG